MAHALLILGFIWWLPVLGFLIARGKLGRRRRPSYAGDGQMIDWERHGDRWDRKMSRMQEKMGRLRARMERAGSRGYGSIPASSGNSAFDDYRVETLKRLEDEQREFREFLERLRFAKDRAEFDQFMTARRQRPSAPESQDQNPPA